MKIAVCLCVCVSVCVCVCLSLSLSLSVLASHFVSQPRSNKLTPAFLAAAFENNKTEVDVSVAAFDDEKERQKAAQLASAAKEDGDGWTLVSKDSNIPVAPLRKNKGGPKTVGRRPTKKRSRNKKKVVRQCTRSACARASVCMSVRPCVCACVR